MDDLVTDGFVVHVGHTVSVFASPVVVASGMHVQIRVEPTRRRLRNNCFERPPATRIIEYDPNGLNCLMNKAGDLFYKFFGCEGVFLTKAPNASTVCHPQQIQVTNLALTSDLSDQLSKTAEKFGKADMASQKTQVGFFDLRLYEN